ncbi:MAG: LamG domain-containing protein, partial [Anaerolineales bacterium]|nr:LamG domain-containing protein [Anaerolineales bacterium]
VKIGFGFDVVSPLEISPADADGYYECAVTFTASLGKSIQHYVVVVDGNGSVSVTAGKTISVKSASLVPANEASLPYQRVNTTTDYDTEGFPHYLKFDGVDDSLVTPTITPGIDKAQVFAGVRKTNATDSGFVAVFAEFSATSTSNPGSFAIFAPNDVAARHQFRSSGTAISNAAEATTLLPSTNVLTGLGDISGDLATLRINGTQAAQSTADQGTGNFLAYPLYIGRRGGTTLPFNGRLYPMIVRFGPTLTTEQIEQTETYVNSKTGAY